MGYYTYLHNSNVYFEKSDLEEAFEAAKALNSRDDLKNGGSSVKEERPDHSKSLGRPDKRFSFTIWNYDETCSNLKEVLEEFRFDVSEESDAIYIGGFDSKIGDEIELFRVLAPFIKEGSFMEWTGESGDRYKWVFEDGELVEYDAQFSWVRRG